MAVGDEIEVSYPEIRPIPHRGLIHRCGPGRLDEIEVIHNSKQPGVCVVTWQDFAKGNVVRLRRQPFSVEHSRLILKRAITLIGHSYDPLFGNCEHFTDFCYNGVQGQSTTLQGIAAVSGVIALVVIAAKSN